MTEPRRVPPDLGILELLYASVDVARTEAARQVPDRELCLQTIDELRRRGLLELLLQTCESLSPLPEWQWREFGRTGDPELEARVVLRKTEAGTQELTRRFDELL